MQIGPGCFTVAPARAIAVTGPAFPWKRDYVTKKQELVNSPGINNPVRSDELVGRRLFTMEPLNSSSWMELDIVPLGTIFYQEGDPVPTEDDIASAPDVLKRWTPAKARVTYYLAGGAIRQCDFDIGAGVTVAIPPTNKVDIDLLVWSDAGPTPQELIDSFFAPDTAGGLVNTRFATKVSAKCTCINYASELPPPKFTQLAYLDSTPGPPSGVGAQIPLQSGASSVQLKVSNLLGVPLVAGQIRANFRLEDTNVPQNVTPPMSPVNVSWPETPIDLILVESGAFNFDTPVPRSFANVVRVSNDPTISTSANVVIDQTIDC